jgi:membrane peptidoglycan carboxypeptidase
MSSRYTTDIVAITGQVGLPNPDPLARQYTYQFWGYDVNALLTALSNEFALTTTGNPNGLIGSAYAGRKIFNTVTHDIWICTVAGTTSTAVWINYTSHVVSQVSAGQGDAALVMAIALS